MNFFNQCRFFNPDLILEAGTFNRSILNLGDIRVIINHLYITYAEGVCTFRGLNFVVQSIWQRQPNRMSNRLSRLTNTRTSNEETTNHASFLPDIPIPYGIPTGVVAISEMANIFGVTHRTLHFYEEKALIKADRIGIMRVYNQHQVKRMAAINLCREVGMPISVIQELMASLEDAASQEDADSIFGEAMHVRRRELLASESTIRRQMQQINTLLEDNEKTSNDKDRAAAPYLTEIEHKCIGLMAEGYATTRLSRALGIDFDEIVSIEKTIIRKFNANNRFQAVAKAVLLGMIKD